MCSIPLLKYRETEGIKVQQNAIDKAKGIVAKPMPRYWHDRHSVNLIEDPEERRFQLSIVADKKPYFMRYIYPALSRQYNTYIKTTNKNAVREFGMTVDELEQIPEQDHTDRQGDFLRYYYSRIPVGTGDCVMNKICRRFEQEFDGYLKRYKPDMQFDYEILKSGERYGTAEFKNVSRLYDSYCRRIKELVVHATYEYVDEIEYASAFVELRREFDQECAAACPNESILCDIMLDLCYTKSSTKSFAWDMCGAAIIQNLLRNSGGRMQYPTLRADGDIEFRGMRFAQAEVRMEESDGDCVE